MSRLNDPENFRGRVNYAAKVIAYGHRPTRAFDNCFENWDGDEVATVIVRRARKNQRLAANLHRYLSMASIEEAAERLADVPTRKLPEVARAMGGGTRQKPRIWFSGFWSQGDGASFESLYSYRKDAPRALRSQAPQDVELHAVADAMQAIQRRNFYQLHADISHRGHYHHEFSMDISVQRDSPTYQPMTDDAEEALADTLRDLARWLYRQLRAEYEHLTSDEAVDEVITANAYTWRRNHPAGWLGGYGPEDFTQQVQFDGPPLPCHKTIPPRGEAKAMCAGALIFMKNSCKGANHPDYGNALDTVEQDTEHVFQWASEFLAHHNDRASWIARMKAKAEGPANG